MFVRDISGSLVSADKDKWLIMDTFSCTPDTIDAILVV
jgi:hypothetical protein